LKYQKTFSKIDLTNKSFLDIGCNSGLFCFNAKKNQAKSTTGIDINYEFIRLANDINKYKYDFNNMKWVFGDIFEFYPLSTYDMIFCASVFHYFGTKQLDFIKKLHELLDNNGIIYLEVEISPKLNIDVDISTRGNDSQPLHYPTEKGFNVMISELFNIDNKEESAFQPGSLYTRYFYTLVKKYHK
jgi:SAM-dependent methyltransferase